MPELPEVETVRRGLEPAMLGAVIARVEQRRPDLRFPFPDSFAERLTGRRVEALGRRAKYLVVDLDDAAALIMHLGMSGSFRIERAHDADAAGSASASSSLTPGEFHYARDKSAAHDHVVLHLSNGLRIVYNDPRRFGFMRLLPRAALADDPMFAGMGVEPLGNELDGAHLAQRLAGKKTPLKAALLDQAVIAGLGNIYVCEALNRARLSPKKMAGLLARPQARAKADALVGAIKAVLHDAISAGGSSLRDHRQTDGAMGYFQHAFRAYDREGEQCRNEKCGGEIRRIVQSGRSTFYCPRCQR